MYEDDTRFQRTISLLRAQQEASIDGILVVNEQRRMVSCNRRFLELWDIPDAIARTGEDEAMIGHVLGRLADPDAFVARVMHLYAHPGETSRDEIALRDGRVFDRYSAPVVGEEGEHFGRIWLFRDITARKRAEAALDEANHRLREALRTLEDRDAAMRTDLEQAWRFQQSILPALPAVPHTDLDVVYRPAERVGGDLYHVALRGGAVRLFVADATGHGVPAALSTMLLRSEYEATRAAARRPSEVLRTLNERMVRCYGRVGVRFTAVCADLDVTTGALCWSTAAHPPPFHLRSAGAAELATGGTFVGLSDGLAFPEWTAQLVPGDAVCFYTDGVTEACAAGGEAFGDARLGAALVEAHGRGDAHAAAVERAVRAFLGERQPLGDDATVVALRWRGED